VPEFEWLTDWMMMGLLETHCERVTEPQDGDIVAFFRESLDRYGLQHAAFYRDGNIVLHKPGACPIEESTVECNKQKYGHLIAYYRPKNNLTSEQLVLL
jgi:hypothetical protein